MVVGVLVLYRYRRLADRDEEVGDRTGEDSCLSQRDGCLESEAGHGAKDCLEHQSAANASVGLLYIFEGRQGEVSEISQSQGALEREE